ncbi:MAG: hypothetical protein AB8B77_07340 [Alphaproteobacteria bacterium]
MTKIFKHYPANDTGLNAPAPKWIQESSPPHWLCAQHLQQSNPISSKLDHLVEALGLKQSLASPMALAAGLAASMLLGILMGGISSDLVAVDYTFFTNGEAIELSTLETYWDQLPLSPSDIEDLP